MTWSEAAIARVAHGLIAADLPCAEWTHEAHWAAAVWLIADRGPDEAQNAIPSLIRQYNVACGRPNSETSGYHETITIASMRAAANAWAIRQPGDDTAAVLRGILASPLGQPGWLDTHWSPERLWSPQARREWVEPDRAALPF